MRRSPALAMALGAAVVFAAAACGRRPESPQATVTQFYTMLDAAGIGRVPDSLQLEALRPYLADTLARALNGARVLRDSSQRASPTEKPPWADGDPFSSLFEGRTATVVKDTRTLGDTALVAVQFTNDRQKPAVVWIDTVVVVSQGGQYRIADIRYGSTWEFGFRGRLLNSLLAQP